MNAQEAFRQAMEAAGMSPPDAIEADGKLHRFSPTGKRGDDAGWYVLHLDGVPAGAFGDWRSGESQGWCAKEEADLSIVKRKAVRKRVEAAQCVRAAEIAQRQAEAAARAQAVWEQAVPAIRHPYLAVKAVRAYGVRLHQAALLVPMRDSAGKLHSVQTIGADGVKRFLAGGRVRGCYHSIGRLGSSIIVCEGLATGATLHQATGDAVAVAFNANNLAPVAIALRTKYPKLPIVIAADDDWKTPGNPGLAAAKLAAKAVGGKSMVPDFFGLERAACDTDFNDLCRLVDAASPETVALREQLVGVVG